MPLPKIETKFFNTNLLSDKSKIVKFRPFTIGEQKQIMLVKENSDNEMDIYKSISQLVQNCAEGIDVYELYNIDFEKIFYDLRTVSDGHVLNFSYICTDEKCKNNNEFTINVQTDLEASNKNFSLVLNIKEANLNVHLRQPKLKDSFLLEKNNKSQEEKTFDLMVYCIDKIVKGEQVYNNFTFEEAKEFFESLPQNYLDDIVKFFEKTPTLVTNKEFACSKCGKKLIMTKEDSRSFLS